MVRSGHVAVRKGATSLNLIYLYFDSVGSILQPKLGTCSIVRLAAWYPFSVTGKFTRVVVILLVLQIANVLSWWCSLVYFEMTVLPRSFSSITLQPSMTTLSIGLSTEEMPVNALVGAWQGRNQLDTAACSPCVDTDYWVAFSLTRILRALYNWTNICERRMANTLRPDRCGVP